jgi:hypothetical protein
LYVERVATAATAYPLLVKKLTNQMAELCFLQRVASTFIALASAVFGDKLAIVPATYYWQHLTRPRSRSLQIEPFFFPLSVKLAVVVGQCEGVRGVFWVFLA